MPSETDEIIRNDGVAAFQLIASYDPELGERAVRSRYVGDARGGECLRDRINLGDGRLVRTVLYSKGDLEIYGETSGENPHDPFQPLIFGEGGLDERLRGWEREPASDATPTDPDPELSH